jgi:hypothetical protein
MSMHYQDYGLGDEQIDSIIRSVVESARSLFPQQTAEAEAWITARLANYGVDYAKYRAQQLYSSASEWLSNPVILIGLGLLGGYLVFKK